MNSDYGNASYEGKNSYQNSLHSIMFLISHLDFYVSSKKNEPNQLLSFQFIFNSQRFSNFCSLDRFHHNNPPRLNDIYCVFLCNTYPNKLRCIAHIAIQRAKNTSAPGILTGENECHAGYTTVFSFSSVQYSWWFGSKHKFGSIAAQRLAFQSLIEERRFWQILTNTGGKQMKFNDWASHKTKKA